ncbi:CSLREA domain-containing protein [bacterium]|nr:CSLREA domain-containing protein [bacterium]
MKFPKFMLMVSLFVLCMIPGSDQLLADYDSDGVELVGRYPYGYCVTASTYDEYVCISNGTVMEILNVHTMDPVGQIITESIVSSIFVDSTFAYIANWSDGFKVVDISDPFNPVLVDSLAFEGQCWDVSVFGDYAYLGNDVNGLQIINVTDPTNVVHSSTFLPETPSGFEYAQVVGDIAYASSQSGLYILDISDPTNPTELSYSASENGSWMVHVVDTVAYLPEFTAGIRMLNISDPENPVEMGYFGTPSSALWMEVVGTTAYVAATGAGIEILDVSDLTAPDSIGIFGDYYADAFHIQGDTLYLATSSTGLALLDISESPDLTSVADYSGGGYSTDIYTRNDYSFVSQSFRGIAVYHHLDPENIIQVALLELGSPRVIHGQDDFLYVSESDNLHIVDISDPLDPQILSTWYEGAALTAYARDNLLYIGGNPDLQVLDISDPANPFLVGEFNELPWVPFDIKVVGPFAYVVNRGGGFWIINIGDPTSPELVAGLENVGYAWRLDVAGQYAYIADRYDGMIRIIDISDPEMPFETAAFQINGQALSVYASGRYVYVTDSWDGLRVIDCGNPYAPEEVGYFNTGGYTQEVYADDGQLTVSDGGGGIYFLQTEFKQAVFTVNSTGDDGDVNWGDGICDDGTGDCTLRAAIEEANMHPGYDKIVFELPGPGVHTFQPGIGYPIIEQSVIIDATTQQGYSGTPIIELDGSMISDEPGFQILAGHCTIKGFVINRYGDYGINILSGKVNVIQSNYIGTDPTGTLPLPNGMGGLGVGTHYNMIGGNQLGSGNVISGNSSIGIGISGNDNLVQGNFIGTDITGSIVLSNEAEGINISGNDNIIGGIVPGSRNVISGNVLSGIDIVGGATGNQIRGNYIGTDVSGTTSIANGGNGFWLDEASNNTIGGLNPGDGNLISGNIDYGIQLYGSLTSSNVIQGNFIGTDYSGMTALGNDNSGINIRAGAHDNLIGGVEDGAGNLISGNNRTGISMGNESGASGNVVQRNLIGTDITGTSALGNTSNGIALIAQATNNVIGGPQAGNVISGNHTNGISIRYDLTRENVIQGNFIGSDITGTEAIPNLAAGIYVTDSDDNLIGGLGDGEGNIISANNAGGLWLDGEAVGNMIQRNMIGTQVDGMSPLGNNLLGINILEPALGNHIGENSIAYNVGTGVVIHGQENPLSMNSIYSNDGLGIDLGDDGPTANDAGDADDGANKLQNFPESLNVGIDDNDDIIIQYLIDTDPENGEYPLHVEFFVADEEGEGKHYLINDEYTLIDHESGLKTINIGNPANYGLEMGNNIVGTATDGLGNTSEFSEMNELGIYVDVGDPIEIPDTYVLEQNYPNPFNPITTLRYGLPDLSDVSLMIYDVKGRVIWSISESAHPAGWVNLEWKGVNSNGEPVSTGVYFCRMVAGEYTETIKMVYLK